MALSTEAGGRCLTGEDPEGQGVETFSVPAAATGDG